MPAGSSPTASILLPPAEGSEGGKPLSMAPEKSKFVFLILKKCVIGFLVLRNLAQM